MPAGLLLAALVAATAGVVAWLERDVRRRGEPRSVMLVASVLLAFGWAYAPHRRSTLEREATRGTDRRSRRVRRIGPRQGTAGVNARHGREEAGGVTRDSGG